MVKAKSFKKLGILLISLISIISMARIQVNAIRYMDGRFITNINAIYDICIKANGMSDNLFNPYEIKEGPFRTSNIPQIFFSIMSNQGLVREILLMIPSLNARERVYMSLKPKDQMPIIDAIRFLRESQSEELNNLFECEHVATSLMHPNISPNISLLRLAPTDFYTALRDINTEVQYTQLLDLHNRTATIRPYELFAGSGEFIVINNVEVR